MLRFRLTAFLALLAAGVSQPAASKVDPIRSTVRVGTLTLETVDLSPRFRDFQAAARYSSPDARFVLWQQRYGFAALPPTSEGQAIARAMLDSAWSRYPAAERRIAAGLAEVTPHAAAALASVARLLHFDRPATVRLTGFVGSFENNAFTMLGDDKVPTLALPIEGDADAMATIIPHEAAHAIHALVADFAPGYERSLARVIVEEGLAMHVSRMVAPGHSVADYTEHKPGWHKDVTAALPAIARGMRPLLASSSQDDVMRFTMGNGSTGREREAYAMGWVVVGNMLRHGRSAADIARIPETETQMPAEVGRVLDRLYPASAVLADRNPR